MKNFLLLFISLVLSLWLVELLLRFTAKDAVPLSVPDRELGHIYRKEFETARFEQEPQKLVHSKTNSYGLADGEWEMDRGGRKIMVLGDSFVDAMQVDQEQRFTNLLEQKFLTDQHDVRVMNFGKAGSGPEIYLAYLKHFYPVVKPDAVIVALFNGNDFENVNYRTNPGGGRLNYLVEGGRVVRYKDQAPLATELKWELRMILGKLYLPQMIYKVYSQTKNRNQTGAIGEAEGCPFYAEVGNPDRIDSFTITEFILREMKDIAAGKLVILQIPVPGQFGKNPSADCDYSLPEKFIQNMSAKYDIKAIQLLPLMGEHIGNYYWSHFNYEGHRFVADVLHDFFVNHYFKSQ